MRSILLIASLLVMLSVGMANAADSVWVESVSTLITPTKITMGETVRFTLHWTYAPATPGTAFKAYSTGFKIYEKNGGDFHTATGDFIYDFAGQYLGSVHFVTPVSLDGSGADTVGFGGFFVLFGIDTEFDETVYYIESGSDTHGDTLCIDSCYYPPGGTWLWSTEPASTPVLEPEWGGPYCFHVQDATMDVALDGDAGLPTEFSLGQNYPNPFNPTTEIKFDVPSQTHVSLKIFNVLGQEVETLVDKELSAGKYVADWDGSGAASGVYFYKLESEDFTKTRKMVLVK